MNTETDKKQAAIDFAGKILNVAIQKVEGLNGGRYHGQHPAFSHLVAAFVGSATGVYIAREMMEHASGLHSSQASALERVKRQGDEITARLDARLEANRRSRQEMEDAQARINNAMETLPEKYKGIIAESDVLNVISYTPELKSLLRDLELLPEQLASTTFSWQKMLDTVKKWIKAQGMGFTEAECRIIVETEQQPLGDDEK